MTPTSLPVDFQTAPNVSALFGHSSYYGDIV